jgi:hypothetical protein
MLTQELNYCAAGRNPSILTLLWINGVASEWMFLLEVV